MSPQELNWKRRRLRAPKGEGEVLTIPPLAEMPATIAQNRQQIANWDVRILGKSLAELRQIAREEVLTAAVRFTHQADTFSTAPLPSALPLPANLDVPLIVGGHQPELFHPGVWAKNFLLNRLIKSIGGFGLHLIVDNDAVSSTRIAVPVGSRELPRIELIPFDADADAVPWEEAQLRDESLFRSFADRVSTALSCWPIAPMLPEVWPAAVKYFSITNNQPQPKLVDLLTVVRREAERRAGLSHFELPISQLCETESFAWFACSLLDDPQRTHTVYNEVVAEYRHVNKVRNRQRPVPDLGNRENGAWLEFPFWVWRADNPRRGRLFVRATSTDLQLANGETVIASFARPTPGAADSAVAQLRALSSHGWKLRPRALTTTLFARVFLADAFLHGIGGAKYDEMTDRLIARLFGVAPPSYLTVTATHRLPLSGWDVTPSDVAALKHRLWDFDHNPERHLATNQQADRNSPLDNSSSDDASGRMSSVRREFTTLLAEKQRLIAEQHAQDTLDRNDSRRASRAANDQRRRRLRAINRNLATLATETRSALTTELQAAQKQLAANAVLRSREYSFCLFPTSHKIS